MVSRFLKFLLLLYMSAGFGEAFAKPGTAEMFCNAFSFTPSCSGNVISCAYCHAMVPPALNAFGSTVRDTYLKKGQSFPKNPQDLQDIVAATFPEDSDKDGFTNEIEIRSGSLPGSNSSKPTFRGCDNLKLDQAKLRSAFYRVCDYDYDYAYKKVWLTVCGELPDYEEFRKFQGLSIRGKVDALDKQLDDCLEKKHWRGKDGVVWELGHYKIRPVGTVKAGEDPGYKEIVDYYDDYHLFVYTQIDDHDARDVLLADYTVKREEKDEDEKVTYTKRDPKRLSDGQVMQPEKRVGLISSFWNMAFYLNYTGIARVLVAQAFIAYLGIDLSQMQGLHAPDVNDSKFKDYDGKGVTKPECAVCHTTVDPLAYPFRNYNGLTGTKDVTKGLNSPGLKSIDNLGDERNLSPLSYSLSRMNFLNLRYPGIVESPEEGYIFGQKVRTLKEWAQVAANSNYFASNTARDYWRALVGHNPRSEEALEYTKTWQAFKATHNFRVKPMLHDLIRTEAFGVP